MLRDRFTRLALAVTAMTMTGSVVAADAPPAQGPYVVLVGVGEFADAAIPARPVATVGANAFYDLFADTKYFTVSPDRLVLLSSQGDEKRHAEKATRENIIRAVKTAVAKTSPGDQIIIGYFGRGASSGESTSLFASDTQFATRGKTGVLGSDLDATLREAENRKIVLMVDADFTGFKKGDDKVPVPSLEDYTKPLFNRDDDGDKLPSKNKVMMLASSPLNPPLLDGKQDLFTSLIITALKGAADAEGYYEGYEPDGVISVEELVKYVEKKAPDQARELGKTDLEKETVPVILGEELSHFGITRNPKVSGKVDERLRALAKLGTDDKIPADALKEGRDLISRMPKLKAMQELRKNYQSLADGAIPPADFAAERKKIKDSLKLSPDAVREYAKTVMQAVDLARSRYVKSISGGDWTAMAIRGLYYKLDEPIPEAIETALKNSKGLQVSEQLELLEQARANLGKREDLEGTKAVDTTISWMFIETHDPYTTYFDHELIKKMDAPLRGEFRGVGIQIRQDLVRNGLLVVSPIKGSPAYKAGIQAGDLIIGIKRDSDPQGDPLKPDDPREFSTKGMKTERAIEIILGKVGVPITLVVQRDGEKKPLEFTLRRALVTVETVLGVKRDKNDDWEFYVDPANKIGYICLTQFTPSTGRDVLLAVEKLKQSGLKGLVLDLRYNPGGLLTQAVAISDMFIDDGLIVSVKYRYKEPENWYDRGIAKMVDFPMAVLVNERSASASEIVSACLQDYDRAIIIGERTYGKGSVQNVEAFEPTRAQIKMTTARYFPPLGRNIDRLSTKGTPEEEWGVKPDKGFEVKLDDEEKRDLAEHFRDREVIGKRVDKSGKPKPPFVDRQLERAVKYLRDQAKLAAS